MRKQDIYKKPVMGSKKGFTLIELIIVVLVLAILAAVAVPVMANAGEKARYNADMANVRTLNLVTAAHRLTAGGQDVFLDENMTNQDLLGHLVATGYLSSEPLAQTKNAEFAWDPAYELWVLMADGSLAQLTPLGNDFQTIYTGMIGMIQDYHTANGKYPRSWDPFNYTDLGLDPAFWKNQAYDNVIYTPVGNRLQIEPGPGYSFFVITIGGDTKKINGPGGNSLKYMLAEEKWYYANETFSENEFNIETLVIKKTQ